MELQAITAQELATVDMNKYKVRVESNSTPVLKMRAADTKDDKYPGVKEGEYYIQIGDKVHSVKSPKVVLMEHKTSYSYFKKELLAWTDEFADRGFDNFVNLYDKSSGTPVKAFTGTQSEFFKWKKDPANAVWKANLRYKHILYVVLPELNVAAKLFVSNASYNGVLEGAAESDYENPRNDSFAMYEERLVESGIKNEWFFAELTLGSYLVKEAEKPFYCMNIVNERPHDDIEMRKYILIMDKLQGVMKSPVSYEEVNNAIEVPEVVYASEVTVDSLPF